MNAAIPTVYRDTTFRSRLEARWAAFFDLNGWRWQYEPIDLDGWTPDFVLKGAANDMLVEVKPIDWANNVGPEQILQHADIRKALNHRKDATISDGLKTEILIIGNGPQWVDRDWVLGVFVDESQGAAPDWAVLCHNDRIGNPFDFVSREGCYAYRIAGDWEGNDHIVPVNDERPTKVWGWAGSATQYKGPHAGPLSDFMNNVLRDLKPKQ